MSPVVVHEPGALRPRGELATARAAVEGALPGDEGHERARREILAFLDAHPDALHRTCTTGHLTGSALVVEPTTHRVLLLLHTKVGRWLQPGGHADGDGELAHVSLREAEEETGISGLRVVTPAIDLDVHVFRNAAGTEPDHLHLDVRHLVLAPPDALVVGNHESQGIAWVSPDQLERYDVDAGTVRMVTAGLRVLAAIGGEAQVP